MSDARVPPRFHAHLDAALELARTGVAREYPHHGGPTIRDDADVRPPRQWSPVFHGCFDWHSAVHAHWTLARLARFHPPAADAASLLHARLTPPALLVEAQLIERNPGFERPYGWAWALRLHAELHVDRDRFGSVADAMTPLIDTIERRLLDYLPRLRWPVRAGAHANTAYALSHMLDWADAADRTSTAAAIRAAARRWFADDAAWPFHYEPSGEDFLSAGLTEADLMRRIDPDGFPAWWARFAPGFGVSTFVPVTAVDLSDGRLSHLAGLNLARAAALAAIGAGLDDEGCLGMAAAHLEVGLGQVRSGDYAGEHWLGTFAVYALTQGWLVTLPR